MMQYEEEEKLSKLKADYENIIVPSNIDEYIFKGTKKYPRAKAIGLRLRPLSIAAIITLFILISMIRISPVFADYLSEVPVLKYIVKLVNYDKGLKSAVENNFIQNVALSDEHGDIKLKIDSIIIDQARMIVFYTIENNSSYKFLELDTVKIADETGKNLEAAYSYNFPNAGAKQGIIQDNIKVSFVENSVIPDMMHFEFALRHKDSIDSTNTVALPYLWQFNIPIDKSIFENLKEIYDINQTIEIENQKIIFEQAILSPTRLELQIAFPEENTKRILRFDDLKILNEKGDSLAAITDDISASMPDENHINLYFESNFFSNPQKLYIQGSSIRALDKDKLDIIIDIEKKQLIKAPDNNVKLQSITQTGEGTNLSLLLNTDEVLDYKYIYFVFAHKAVDANGTEYDINRSATSSSSDSVFNQEVMVTVPKKIEFKNPITFRIEDYPTRIKGDFLVRIK